MASVASSDTTTEAALAATTTRDAWCRALATAVGSGYKIVWRNGGTAVLTLTMSGTLPVRAQTCRVFAQPSSIAVSAGTPTVTRIESSDGTRWAQLDRMLPLVDGNGAAISVPAGAGFVWRGALVVEPPVALTRTPAWLIGKPALELIEISGDGWDTSIYNARTALGMTATEAVNVTAFSGFAPDDTELHLTGGGHTDWAGNGVYLIDVYADQPGWSVCGASRLSADRDASTFNATSLDGWYSPIDSPTGYENHPVELHSYWLTFINRERNRFLRVSSGGVNDTLDGRSWAVAGLDRGTGQWDPPETYPPIPFTSNGSMDAAPAVMDDQGRLWLIAADGGTSKLAMCNTNADPFVWTSASNPTGAALTDCQLIFDPARRWLFRASTTNDATRGQTFDIGPSYTSGLPTATWRAYDGASTVDLTQIRTNVSWVYCPDIPSANGTGGCYIGIKWKDRTMPMFKIDPDTWIVTAWSVGTSLIGGSMPALPAGTLGGKQQYYRRWAYVPSLKGIVFMPRADGNLYFIRTA